MSLLKDQALEVLANLNDLTTELETVLVPLLSRPLSETTKNMDPLDSAKLQATLAYLMNSLYLSYMRLQNTNLVGHEISRDMDRLKGYLSKLQMAETSQANVKLNKEAAKRFISNALWEARETPTVKSKADSKESKDDSKESS